MVRLKAHERDPRRRVRLSNRPETNGKHRRKKRPILPAASLIPLSLPLYLSLSPSARTDTDLQNLFSYNDSRDGAYPFAMVMDTFNPIATVPSKSWALDNDEAGSSRTRGEEGRGSVTMSRNIG